MDMLTDLYDNLEDDPGNIMTRELILDAWIQLGDQDMATGVATEIQKLDPSNASARTFFNSQRLPSSSTSTSTSSRQPAPAIKGKKAIIRPLPLPRTEQQRAAMESSFTASYTALIASTASLDGELRALQTLGSIGSEPLEDLQHLLAGRLSTVVSRQPPRPIRDLARSLSARGADALELIIADFEEVLDWTLSNNPSAPPDAIRTRLLQRQTLLQAAVPDSLSPTAKRALTHVEHERLRRLSGGGGRTYANAETMLGDDVSSIPRANLLVTEDNYAWDMAELADCLAANAGVMRNPLTRAMFSAEDVRAVLAHPLGARLAPVRLEQDQLKKGARQGTIDRIAGLAATMLADQTADASRSMAAVDEFLVYVAGLPSGEQKTLDELKIPASDSHTGLAFDYTVGESVRDAKANRTCFHKTGDFLGQAARYLGRS